MRLIFREESGKNGVWYGTDEKLSVIDYYVSYMLGGQELGSWGEDKNTYTVAEIAS
jgi:hypothetical protein